MPITTRERRSAFVTRAPDDFRIATQTVPLPGPDDVGIVVQRASIGFGDLIFANARREKKDERAVPGLSVAGVVDAVGSNVTAFRPGERVVAYARSGGYTSYAIRRAVDVFAIPDSVAEADAVVMPVNYVTALQCLRRVARVEPGQTVFIHGASGGVGTALSDLCRAFGIRAVGTASLTKRAVVDGLGVEWIDRHSANLRAPVASHLPKIGADAAFDAIGGGGEALCFDVVRPRGVAVSFGVRSVNASGEFRFGPVVRAQLSFLVRGLVSSKRAKIYVLELRKRKAGGADYRADVTELLALLADEKIHPVIAKTFALDEAEAAHDAVNRGMYAGNVILDCS
jgi:NADPH:quinone reductase-like Zn-dependent oxidoreductase